MTKKPNKDAGADATKAADAAASKSTTKETSKNSPKNSKASRHGPVTIKKYANRRLYNTGTSTYVTLDDLARMVRRGEDFTVVDARTQDIITRQVLAQIIFEQESKGAADTEALLPLSVMRQLIGFYGDSMQAMVPKYLEYTMDALDRDQDALRANFARSMTGALGEGTARALEARTRQNMEMFTKAMTLFNPFAAQMAAAAKAAKPGEAAAPSAPDATPKTKSDETDLDALKRQMTEMQERLAKMTGG